MPAVAHARTSLSPMQQAAIAALARREKLPISDEAFYKRLKRACAKHGGAWPDRRRTDHRRIRTVSQIVRNAAADAPIIDAFPLIPF